MPNTISSYIFGVTKVNKKDKHLACLFCSKLITLDEFEKSHQIRRHSEEPRAGARGSSMEKAIYIRGLIAPKTT
jgi:hypothetical protein